MEVLRAHPRHNRNRVPLLLLIAPTHGQTGQTAQILHLIESQDSSQLLSNHPALAQSVQHLPSTKTALLLTAKERGVPGAFARRQRKHRPESGFQALRSSMEACHAVKSRPLHQQRHVHAKLLNGNITLQIALMVKSGILTC